MKNEGKNAKHGFKIMTAVITVCAVLCTVFSAMSLVLQYKDHIMLKEYGDFGISLAKSISVRKKRKCVPGFMPGRC